MCWGSEEERGGLKKQSFSKCKYLNLNPKYKFVPASGTRFCDSNRCRENVEMRDRQTGRKTAVYFAMNFV